MVIINGKELDKKPQDKLWMGDIISEALLGDIISEALLTGDHKCMVILPPEIGESLYIDSRLIVTFLDFLNGSINNDEFPYMLAQLGIENSKIFEEFIS